ncbi:hypothetical protein CH76_06800 [Lysinibacillus sp. BF-4]|uniref:YqeG family HAD IIIA-type phosphatase n=1 Tax=Lysinibacillus sp. BF-4 TaxID=1473546 RepID=UPI000504CD4E|nr:YqeG family HAD IIIA-type phosphatase [Lysinibacillus sp. BF-4]KFL43440.1 hypothetical protein CH76_06800 [Lysinibacillus sp. BF-4]
MYNFLLPKQYVETIYEITPESLKAQGVKGVVTDLDNTLIEWDSPYANDDLAAWFERLAEGGIRVIIASNNNEARVKAFAEPVGIPYISRAKKPLGNGFYSAMIQLGLRPHETAMVGDQLLTDIMGGNRMGMHTILVRPVAQSDGLVTKFNRFVERRVFNDLRRKGKPTWEDKK